MTELHHLRYLPAAVRTGSVTAAAEAEFVAQPSVSKQMRALVASGGGIAFAPRMSLAGRDDVVGVRVAPPLQREIGRVRRPGRHLPRIATELLALMAPHSTAQGVRSP